MKYLFTNFLNDKRVYNLAVAYWHRVVDQVASTHGLAYQPYINVYDSSGQKEYDANPIFSALFPSINKAVRIIQDEPEVEAPDLASWKDQIEWETGRPTPELVLAVALSNDSAFAARQLIMDWLSETE
mgnify:CR=1 FL=1